MTRLRCKYVIVSDELGEPLVIRDVGHTTGMSITNDVEALVLSLRESSRLTLRRRLVYIDSDGLLTEILHDGEKFTGFGDVRL